MRRAMPCFTTLSFFSLPLPTLPQQKAVEMEIRTVFPFWVSNTDCMHLYIFSTHFHPTRFPCHTRNSRAISASYTTY